MKLSAIIIEDEPLAREILRDYCTLSNAIDLVAEFGDVFKANDWLHKNRCDLIFLDINLPRVSGLDWLRAYQEKNAAAIVFTTAYSDYVSESYELKVSDYLLKPISFERFNICVQNLLGKNPVPTTNHILIKADKAHIPLQFEAIHAVQGMGDYIKVITEAQNYITLETMKSFLKRLPEVQFHRPHKSWIINRGAISKIEDNIFHLHSDLQIPIGKKYKDGLLDWLDE